MNEYPKVSEGILGEQDIPKTNTELFLSLVGQYFPEAIKDGEVDFAALKEEMGEFAEVGSEHYDFTWAGKQAAKKEAQSDLFGMSLRYKPEDSLNPDTTENIYIEGDNLEALKLLRRNYHGKIKMIYIDPPYNTGNDFIYRDDFTMTEDEIAELSGDVINDKRLQKNTKDDAKYHTKWLNNMYPRLKLAKELLSDDGVIFISIDDNEQANLKKICDEVFGGQNFIGEIIRKTKSMTADNGNGFNLQHEYLLIYSKNTTSVYLTGEEKTFKNFSNPDNDPNGDWCTADPSAKSGGNTTYYGIENPYTHKVDFPPVGRYWAFSKSTLDKYIKSGRIKFKMKYNENERGFIFKRYRNNMAIQTEPVNSLFSIENEYMNQAATIEMKNIFDGSVFSYPKPVEFLKKLIKYSNANIILDFFSGSATTAHAVMQLNAEDGGNRKFIMVQLPEKTDEKSEAYKAGYKNICEIGKERIRRAAKKIHEENPDAKFDDGFKVFEVGKTNIRWNLMSDDELSEINKVSDDTELLDFTDGHTDINIVYEIMLRQYGIPLSTPIEKLSEISDRTYIFADAVVVCLEPTITDELIEKLAAIEPLPAKYVLRDSAFGDNIEFKDFSFRKLSALISSHQTEEERKSKYNNYTVEFI